MTRRRYELTDKEWLIIEPLLPNKPRGVPRIDDRHVLTGILWRFCSGAPWAEVPERYDPSTTCYNRFICWRKAGVQDGLLAAVSAGFNGELVMIDSTCMRVHQHDATGKKGDPAIMAWDVPGTALRPNSTLLSTLMDVLSACD